MAVLGRLVSLCAAVLTAGMLSVTLLVSDTRRLGARPEGEGTAGGKEPRECRTPRTYPQGLLALSGEADTLTFDESADATTAEIQFFRYLEVLDVECTAKQRLGRVGDGGWDMCVTGPYTPTQPCLVYSFGIAGDFSFDDAIASKYGCQVRSFDPSMSREEHQHSARVSFHPLGLGGRREVTEGGWRMDTLAGFMATYKESNRTLDYLKFDIEGGEWGALPALYEDGVLDQVRQIGFEVHTRRVNQTTQGYASAMRTLDRLRELGFLKWYHHSNIVCAFQSRLSDAVYTNCQELYYINKKYMHEAVL